MPHIPFQCSGKPAEVVGRIIVLVLQIEAPQVKRLAQSTRVWHAGSGKIHAECVLTQPPSWGERPSVRVHCSHCQSHFLASVAVSQVRRGEVTFTFVRPSLGSASGCVRG